LLDIPHRYQLKEWIKFLNSLGASIHPVWHFNDLQRPDYPFGVSFVCDLIKGASDSKPFWVTELQGGHNLYTGSQPVNPTKEEMEAWMWTSISSGADKTIFWCLNPRTQGGESGEWAMLDYDQQPSHRLKEAGIISGIVEENEAFFKNARPVKDQIVVAYSPETMFLQERNGKGQNQTSRQAKAHFLSVIACVKALRLKGYHPHIEKIDDIDWMEKSAKPRLVFVPHATGLAEDQLKNMKTFCSLGNTLVFSGLTGIFTAEEKIRWNENSIYEELTGLKVLEVSTPENEGNYPLPYETFRLKTRLITAEGAASTHFKHALGKGFCMVIPAMVDLSWYLHPEEKKYPDFLAGLAEPFRNPAQVSLKSTVPGSFCQRMTNGNQFLTVIHIPASKKEGKVTFALSGENPIKILCGKETHSTAEKGSFTLSPGQTFVLLSEKNNLPAKH
jgi:beta-galactosidase